MNVSVGLITSSATPPSSPRHRVSFAPARGTGAGARRNRPPRDF